jgi:ABC-type glycerol-3-phosphate transport system permease component
MEQVPDQLIESAKVDGASEWTNFWDIVMPMCQPAWITLLIFSFIGTWNDYFTPLVFTRSDTMRTLTLAIQLISGGATVVARQGVVAAASFLATAPTIVVFCLLQRRVIQTMAYSGIKG